MPRVRIIRHWSDCGAVSHANFFGLGGRRSFDDTGVVRPAVKSVHDPDTKQIIAGVGATNRPGIGESSDAAFKRRLTLVERFEST